MKTGLVSSSGVIENIIVVDDINNYTPPDDFTVIQSEDVAIGRQVLNGSVVVPVIPPEQTIVPDLTARQFLSALTLQGIITESEAMDRSTIPASIAAVFNTLPPAAATVARITWANMTIVPRQDPLVDALGASLNMMPTQIDDFFRQAATI